MADLMRLDFTVPEEDTEIMLGVLTQAAKYGWEEKPLPDGATRYTVHCDNITVKDSIKALVAARVPSAKLSETTVPNQDWQSAWKEFFTPVSCGRFTVLPPWRLNELPEGSVPIVIDPKSAFGTGHHETTVLCLKTLSEFLSSGRLKKGMRFFDLGTGTGILGIGCALSGLSGIGVDIDPIAIDNAKENIVLNHAAAMEAEIGSIELAGDEKFDVIVANILAEPLKMLASDIMGTLKKDGILILSGILTVQAVGVAEAYAKMGTPQYVTAGEWSALVWA